MKLTRRKTGWWISTDDDELGPYDTKTEATEDLRGLEKFYSRWSKCSGGDRCKCTGRKL